MSNLPSRKRNKKKLEDLYSYEVLVRDWHIKVYFNEYAYINLFDLEEFEERFFMVLEGNVNSTSSKKCNKNMLAKVIIYPSEVWYEPHMLKDDLEAIGNMSIEKKNDYLYKEDTILFRITVPTKSYENIRSYLTYSGKGVVELLGSDLYYRKGDIYYFGFEKSVV